MSNNVKKPEHGFYVSLHNGLTYPALTSCPGHEDANPKDWRPATAAEVKAFEDSAPRVKPQSMSERRRLENLKRKAEETRQPSPFDLIGGEDATQSS